MRSNPDTTQTPGSPATPGFSGILADESGATTLEWALLLGVVAIPTYYIIQMLLATLMGHYGLMTTLNALPFP